VPELNGVPESGEDYLHALQRELTLRGIKCDLTVDGASPQLRIHGPDETSDAPAEPDRSILATWCGDSWWFTWPWPERISPVTDVTTAAGRIMTAIDRSQQHRLRQARPWITVADGPKLRQLRRQQGLSQEKLADRAGMSVATVARLELQPRATCRGRTLARLAAALGEQPSALAAPTPPDHQQSSDRPEIEAGSPRLEVTASAAPAARPAQLGIPRPGGDR
jgi:transcriptional regulator with XRE-family HTH domain